MDAVELRFQLERDKAWRWSELRELENICAGLTTSKAQDRFRRSVVLMLYAHFEGFVKEAFLAYVTALNSESLACSAVNSALMTASLSNLFSELRNPVAKSRFFGALPDDPQLHRFGREREFVERYPEILARPVAIPDAIVETESNLTPVVLKKLLFRLGFSPTLFQHQVGAIHRLLNIRNNVAHGGPTSGVEAKEYAGLRAAVDEIVNAITVELTQAASEKSYLHFA